MKQFIVRSAYRRLKFLGDEIEDRKNLFSGYEKDFMRVVRIARGNIKVNQNHEKLKQNLDEAAKHRARQQAEEALQTKESRARRRCASAPPKELCGGSRDTEGKEAKR